jgi:hypothetical protein
MRISVIYSNYEIQNNHVHLEIILSKMLLIELHLKEEYTGYIKY